MNQNKFKRILLVSLGVIGLVLAVIYFYSKFLMPSYRLKITSQELMPYASHQETRAVICGQMIGDWYEKICAGEFDNVAKDDDEAVSKLLSFFVEIENDKNISDYDRYFLSHLLFATLPMKDSPVASRLSLSQLFGKLKGFISGLKTTLAAEIQRVIDGGRFDEQMVRDFVSTLYDLPRGDNAWVINIMVSKYAWVDGERQPIYSEQFTESFNPFPINATVDPKNINYHLRSFVGSNATSESILNAVNKGTGEMVVYSFSMQSWSSAGYGHDESVPETKMQTKKSFSEENFRGGNIMKDLLAAGERAEKSSARLAARDLAFKSRVNFNAKNRRVKTVPRDVSADADSTSAPIVPDNARGAVEAPRGNVVDDRCPANYDSSRASCKAVAFSCFDTCDQSSDTYYKCMDLCRLADRDCIAAANKEYSQCASGESR